MATATFAVDFGPAHSVPVVFLSLYILLFQRRKKAGPTGPGIELRVGIKKRRSATRTAVNSVVVSAPVCSSEGTLGSVLP
jgi:hypothetical protein